MLLTGGLIDGQARNPGVIEQKTYMWKVYDQEGNFLEVLNDVIGEPSFSQELNSIGSSMTVTLARNSDSIAQTLEPLLDSNNEQILDSNNQTISTTVQSRNKVGAGSSITHNNRVDLYVFYGQTYPELVGAPNGKRIFSGFISEINIKYGETENTEILLMSYGYDLDQYLVMDVDGKTTVAFNSYDPGNIIKEGIAQFKANGIDTYTDCTSIDTIEACESLTGWQAWNGTPTLSLETSNVKQGDAAIHHTMSGSSSTIYIGRENFIDIDLTSPDKAIYYWIYIPTPVIGTFGGRSGILMTSDTTFGSNYYFYTKNTQADGSPLQLDAWNYMKINPATDSHSSIGTVDLTSIKSMRISVHSDGLLARFQGIILDYITYEPSEPVTVNNTLSNVSYTFRLNTYKELLEKAVQLAPYGWNYYIGLGDNLIHFFPKPTTVTHKFVLGKHIKGLNLRSYIGDVVNDVTYTGGGEPALFRRKSITPIAGTRRGLSRLSDSRVTLTSSADILIQGEIDDNKNIQYRSTIDILDKVYDIENIKLGDLIGFSNFNNFVDEITMQVVAINYAPDVVTLQLDTVPRNVPKRLEELRKALATTDNTNTPDEPVVI